MDDFNLLEMFHNLDETAEENNVTIGGYLVEYNQDGKKLIQAVESINVFTIKDGTTIICKGAFSDIESLERIIIPDTVTCIEDYAFQGCCNLNNIIIPKGVKTIGKSAFEGCGKLKAIELSDTVEFIGERTFGCCHSLEKITIPESVKIMGDGVFDGCSSLKTIIFEGIIEKIGVIDGWMRFGKYGPICGEYLYGEDWEREMTEYGYDIDHHYDEDRLKEELEEERLKWRNLKILIPFGEEEYYSKLLNHYYVMKTAQPIDVHNYSLTATDEDIKNGIVDEFGVVYSKDGLRLLRGKNIIQYRIQDGVKAICDEAFTGCESLKSVKLPKSVSHIGNGAFRGCKSLYSIDLSYVKYIGQIAFEDTSLNKIFFPVSPEHIGDYAFSNCKKLWYVVCFPNSNQQGIGIFNNCDNLRNVGLSNVNQIHDRTFEGCISLEYIVFPDSVKSIGICSFNGCKSIKSILIPYYVNEIKHYAFKDCTSLVRVSIGNPNIQIESTAFEGCVALREIEIPQNTKTKFRQMIPNYKDILIERQIEKECMRVRVIKHVNYDLSGDDMSLDPRLW